MCIRDRISGAYPQLVYDPNLNVADANPATSRAGALLSTHFQRRGKGVLLLQDGRFTIQASGHGQVGYNFGIKGLEGLATLTDPNALEEIRALGEFVHFGNLSDSTDRVVAPRSDGVIFNLYRGLSFESSLSLVASASADYAQRRGRNIPVVLRDSSATVSIASRTIRDRLRLYARSGTGSDESLNTTGIYLPRLCA